MVEQFFDIFILIFVHLDSSFSQEDPLRLILSFGLWIGKALLVYDITRKRTGVVEADGYDGDAEILNQVGLEKVFRRCLFYL